MGGRGRAGHRARRGGRAGDRAWPAALTRDHRAGQHLLPAGTGRGRAVVEGLAVRQALPPGRRPGHARTDRGIRHRADRRRSGGDRQLPAQPSVRHGGRGRARPHGNVPVHRPAGGVCLRHDAAADLRLPTVAVRAAVFGGRRVRGPGIELGSRRGRLLPAGELELRSRGGAPRHRAAEPGRAHQRAGPGGDPAVHRHRPDDAVLPAPGLPGQPDQVPAAVPGGVQRHHDRRRDPAVVDPELRSWPVLGPGERGGRRDQWPAR